MSILNRLTVKHLLMNKKRTIVTIIGITLSMALMLGCGLLASSFIDEMRRDQIDSSGAHHVEFRNLSYDNANVIANNLNIEKSYFYTTIGFADFLESQNYYKPYFYIAGASKDMLESLHLKEGRIPQNDHEILISDHVSYNGGKFYKVGDEISLDVGMRSQDGEIIFDNVAYQEGLDEKVLDIHKETYTVVGIINRSYVEDYQAAGYTLFTLVNDYDKNTANYLLAMFYKPKKTFELGKEIGKSLSLDISDINYNDSLLYYYGSSRYDNINTSILMTLSIVLSLLSIGCIIVIYNSFAISTMERKKQFGLYSSIGTTRKQILHTVFFEAFVVGTIGIVLGIMGSFLGIYTVLQILNHLLKGVWNYEFHLVINWLFILVPILFMIVVVFFSALIPAIRASRVTPIEAIRENDDIKMPKKKLKTPKFVIKFFGIEGELALKNMKRNKRKYRITVLSLFISIVLFISFSTYLNYGMSTIDMIDYYDYDIGISTSSIDTLGSLKEIAKDSRVNDAYLYFTDNFVIKLPFNSYRDEYKAYRKEYDIFHDGNDYNSLELIVLNDDVFRSYADKVNASFEDIIFINSGQVVTYENNNRNAYHGTFFLDLPQNISFCNELEEENYHCGVYENRIVPTKEVLPTFGYVSYTYNLVGFVSESHYNEIFEQIKPKEEYLRFYNLQMNTNDVESFYEELEQKYDRSDISISSPKIELKKQKNVILAIKILLYGFISLVTLIGVTSVFNTIHTSINLRRKEFAMLRSMGLTPNGFNKMVLFESLFFGLKSLLYGLPVSFIFVCLIHNSMSAFQSESGILIPWGAILIAVFGVFLIVLLAMSYSVHKIKKENILECIRDENI